MGFPRRMPAVPEHANSCTHCELPAYNASFECPPPQYTASPMALILFNKPFGIQCQFSTHASRPTLADFIDRPNVYPAGRLGKSVV